MEYTINKRLKVLIITLVLTVAITTIVNNSTTNNVIAQADSITDVTYKQGVEAAKYALEGMNFTSDKKTGLPLEVYNYKTKISGSSIDLLGGLSLISTYMSTGEGTVDFMDLGYDITAVQMDGANYTNITNNILTTQTGEHSYKIILNK